MHPRLTDVLELLEEIAPSRLAEAWDNSGLQVGSYSQEIRKVFLALDPTLRTLRRAQDRDAQLLVTHHPLILKPLSRVDINIYPGEVIFEAVRGEISVVSADLFTPLNRLPSGCPTGVTTAPCLPSTV
jgi:putative NIF3 family GTP cyclohydrolase 1 type 2